MNVEFYKYHVVISNADRSEYRTQIVTRDIEEAEEVYARAEDVLTELKLGGWRVFMLESIQGDDIEGSVEQGESKKDS